MKLKLLFLRAFDPSDVKYLSDELSSDYEIMIPKAFTDADLIPLAQDADVMFGYKLTPALLDAAKNLKFVQIPGAGLDGGDFSALKGRNILLCNSHSNAPYVAEHAIALMFALLKKVALHDRAMRRGFWFRPQGNADDELYMSDSVMGKSIGLLGYGHIARHIEKFLKPYGVEIKVWSRSNGNLDEVLSADIVFNTLPLTAQTRGLIGESKLKQMKKTYVIQVSRAEVIDQKALYESLKTRSISGAGIDVWYGDILVEGEKKFPSKNFPFHELDNVVMSPYRASYFRRESPHLRDVVKNLKLYAAEKRLMNIVDLERGY